MPRMERRLAVVTGGATGIGRAAAAALAGRGDQVVLLGRRAEVLERAAAELGARWRRADVSRREDVRAAVDWLVAEVGAPVDVLVNNAGGTGGLADGAPLDQAEAAFDALVDGNLKGSFLMAWALAPHLRRPGGRIINLASIAAWSGRGGLYTVAKAGVVGLTYWLALRLGPEGITVNAVAPGFVEGTEFFGGGLDAAGRAERVGQIPTGRPGRPEEVAAAVAYLASPEAAYVNGEIHHVNGGWLMGR
jgi:3-oxoacyl-[acyl-carrier protein] reductase